MSSKVALAEFGVGASFGDGILDASSSSTRQRKRDRPSPPAPRVRRKPPVPSLTPFAPTPRSSWQATMADELDEPMEVAGEVARRRCRQQKLLLK
eukprot:3069004-Prymnesium_polylepis.1